MSQAAQYDVIIIGAGPAGFTAGIYLARFRLKTLLLDSIVVTLHVGDIEVAGRSSVGGLYLNVPGFPEGIERQDLKWRGILQAQNAGCAYRIDKVTDITKNPQYFTVHCETGEYTATNLFFAMGVQDIWPNLPGLEKYMGHSLFCSVESNGKEAENKEASVIGYDDHAAIEAIRLYDYAKTTTLLTHGKTLTCSGEIRQILEHLKIPVFESNVKTVFGTDFSIKGLTLEDGHKVYSRVLFIPAQFRTPRSQLAHNLGVNVDSFGYIQVNERYETSVANTYAIGDITARGPEQVITSYFQGMHAAIALYEEYFQKRLQKLLSTSKEALMR